MAKSEPGLHKKVSAIFEGVPIPKNDDTEQPQQPEQPPLASKKENSGGTSPKPFIIEQLLSSSFQPSPEEVSPQQPVIEEAEQTPWWKQIENKLFTPKAGVDVGKQKKMAILMIALFVVLIFVIFRVLKQPSPQPVQAQTQTKAQSAGTAAVGSSAIASEGKIDWRRPELYPITLRDPMRTNLSADGRGGSGELIVKGIVYSEDYPSAVIDGQIAHQGEKISGATIVKINKNNVEFEMNGRKWTQEVQR
jgi:hypothetical protein